MEELGRFIKETREKKKISLEALHESTKIRVLYLKAIEEGNFKIIPGVVYLKGFLRNIARELNIDFTEMMQTYAEPIAAYEDETESHDYEEKIPYESKRHIRRGKIIKGTIWLVVIAGLIVAGVYYYINYMQ